MKLPSFLQSFKAFDYLKSKYNYKPLKKEEISPLEKFVPKEEINEDFQKQDSYKRFYESSLEDNQENLEKKKKKKRKRNTIKLEL